MLCCLANPAPLVDLCSTSWIERAFAFKGVNGMDAPAMPCPHRKARCPGVALVDVVRGGQAHCGAQERHGSLLGRHERDRAHGDGACHHERQGWIPVAGKVQEVERIGRIGHAGGDEAEPQDKAGEQ